MAGEGAIQTISFQRALVGRCDLRELTTDDDGRRIADRRAGTTLCVYSNCFRSVYCARLVYTSRQAICVYFRLLSPAARLTTYGLVAGAKVLIVL